MKEAPVTLHSLQIGMPTEQPGIFGAPAFSSGFIKRPVDEAVWLSKNGLDGDGQGDSVHHGGPEKAVCAYPLYYYPSWSKTLARDMKPSAFGENFTLAGCTEESICIGDQFRIGEEVVVEVSQPRSPCWKLAQIYGVKDLAWQLQVTGFTGWYFRVVSEGLVRAGDPMLQTARPFERWTVSRVNQIVYDRDPNFHDLSDLSECRALSQGWRDKLRKRVERKLSPDEQARLRGPMTP